MAHHESDFFRKWIEEFNAILKNDLIFMDLVSKKDANKEIEELERLYKL